MKKITHKCACGAEASWEERIPAYRYDENGRGSRAYSIDELSKDFLASHVACRQAKSEPVKRREIPQPVIDRDECADRRANRASSLGEDCFESEGNAKQHAIWLADNAKTPVAFYSCRVGGKEHWHTEKIQPEALILPKTVIHKGRTEDIPIVDLSKIADDARKAERERIRNIVAGCSVKRREISGNNYAGGEWDTRSAILEKIEELESESR